MFRVTSRFLSSTSFLTGCLIAAPAVAQVVDPDSDTLGEIVVTAQKRVENIQDVPLSIRSIGGDAIEQAGIHDVTQLTKLVPSLQISTSVFAADLTIRIRGFGSPGGNATDSDVAVYMDSAYVPRPGALMASFLDVKNVEVLSGPQGTLFGRNAAMGAVSINSNVPDFNDMTLDVTAEGANYGSYAGSAVVNLPVMDTFALRFAIKHSHIDGFYENTLDSETYGRSNTLVGRISAKWNISPEIRWTARIDGSRTRGDGVLPQIVYVNTATPAALAALTDFNTRAGGTQQVYSADPSYTINQRISPSYLRDNQYGITSDLSWDLSRNLTMRLINTYRDWSSDQLAGDTIATSLDLLNLKFKSTSRADSHELQLISSKGAFLGNKLGFTAGAYYFHEEYDLDTDYNLGSQFCSTLFGGFPPVMFGCLAGDQNRAGSVAFNQSVESYAAYGQIDYAILPSLDLTLGIRQTSDRKTGVVQQFSRNPFIGVVVTTDGPTALRFEDDNTSYRASLAWHVTSDIMAFATYSTGYKSGGFNSGAAAVPQSAAIRTFDGQTVDDFELGFKSVALGGRFQLNATYFSTALDNFQDRSFDGTAFVTRNSGDVKSKGVDVDGQLLPFSKLKLNFGVTYLDATYSSATAAPGLEGCTGLPNCPIVQDLSGQTISYAPKWTGNFGAQWTVGEFLGGYAVVLAGRQNFTSSFLTVNTNNPQSRMEGYETTDLSLSVSAPGDRWRIDLFGQNVFDKHYYVTAGPQLIGAVMGVNDENTGTTLFRGYLGEPARYGMRVSAKF